MLYIWIGAAIVTAIAAQSRGRSFWGWLVIGFLTSFLGLIAVLVMRPIEDERLRADSMPRDHLGRIDVLPKRASSVNAAAKASLLVEGDREFAVKVAGSGSYQDAYERVAGRKTEEGYDMPVLVVLRPEPSNPHDENAVAVWAGHRKMGYLPRQVAKRYRDALRGQGHGVLDAVADARIVGGWYREDDLEDYEGNYGMRIDIAMPPGFRKVS